MDEVTLARPAREKRFGQWREIFPDKVLVTALLDQLLNHEVTTNIRGESYRLKN